MLIHLFSDVKYFGNTGRVDILGLRVLFRNTAFKGDLQYSKKNGSEIIDQNEHKNHRRRLFLKAKAVFPFPSTQDV